MVKMVKLIKRNDSPLSSFSSSVAIYQFHHLIKHKLYA